MWKPETRNQKPETRNQKPKNEANMSEIRNVAVIGAGTMGSGIAQVAASSGFPVKIFDVSAEALGKGTRRIKDSLARLAKKGALQESDVAAIVQRVTTSTDYNDAKNADIIIEAVFEDENVKRQTWTKLDSICRADAIFATNTSSISISQLASSVKNPDRYIGMHFFNPVPVMKLVEVIRANRTSDATCAKVIELSRKMGKNPIEVNDYPGFVSNRVLMPLINEAIFALFEGVAKAEAIDEIFKLGMAHPMGPLTLADFIGLDVCLNILEVLQRGFGDPKYRPCPLLRQMVAAGKLGRKSGEGFYKYQD
jgi:3-hydroxybutyryl-CoA dehydrogenase